MRKYGCLIVEGPHDVEFVHRLLSPFALERVQLLDNLDNFFYSLVPREYPPSGDLQKRMPIPLFLQNQTHAIAIRSAIGDSQLVNTFLVVDKQVDAKKNLTGIGVLLDSDQEITASLRYAGLQQSLSENQFILPNQPGKVIKGSPNLGAFVLPDNHSAGTLENLLIKGAEQIYPNLLTAANNFINVAKNAGIDANELKYFNKPAGEKKAVVGAMANILRPGKALQVSIQDNKWFKGSALQIPEIKAVQGFLKELFEIN